MKQRYFKLLTNGGYDHIGLDLDLIYTMKEMVGDNIGYSLAIPNYEYTLHFFAREVEEVFNYNPNVEPVIDQVFSNKTHLDNYDASLDSKGERWTEETESLVGKRVFSTGATRNTDDGKLDFEGFLSPLVLKRYAEYMHNHRKLEDGSLRDSDNWQKGIPKDQYIKSLFRHFFDTWSNHRGLETKEDQQMNLCGVIFNSMGMLHELLKEENEKATGNI